MHLGWFCLLEQEAEWALMGSAVHVQKDSAVLKSACVSALEPEDKQVRECSMGRALECCKVQALELEEEACSQFQTQELI